MASLLSLRIHFCLTIIIHLHLIKIMYDIWRFQAMENEHVLRQSYIRSLRILPCQENKCHHLHTTVYSGSTSDLLNKIHKHNAIFHSYPFKSPVFFFAQCLEWLSFEWINNKWVQEAWAPDVAETGQTGQQLLQKFSVKETYAAGMPRQVKLSIFSKLLSPESRTQRHCF